MKTHFLNAKIVGKNVNPADYHVRLVNRGSLDYVMSSGELREFSRCPHRWLGGYRDEQTKSTRWGEIQDCRVTAPERFATSFVMAPETFDDPKTGKTEEWNWRKKYCQQWRKGLQAQGMDVLSFAEKEQSDEAMNELCRHNSVTVLLTNVDSQVHLTAIYKDAATDISIPVQILIDFVPTDKETLVDYKTARSADPARWGRTVFDYGYDLQAAFYLDIWNAATGENRINWAHVVQENVAPWEVMQPIAILSSEFIELGRMKYLAALRAYAHSLKTNIWPSYSPARTVYQNRQIIEIEPWMMNAAAVEMPNPCVIPCEVESEDNEETIP